MTYVDKSTKPFPLRWSSPEVLMSRKYSFKSDVWSYGILLWEIFSLGQIPFGQHTSNELAAQLIKTGQMPNRPSLANPNLYKQIILPCWTYESNNRPSFASLKQSLQKIVRFSKQS